MQIERDDRGDFILEPSELAKRFKLSESEFRKNLQRGFVKSTVEAGEGDDAGNTRLTLRCGNRIWQAVIDSAGLIQSETMRIAKTAPPSGHSG